MPDFDIRLITPADTYALRHQVLWPDKPLDYVRIDDDAAGCHFGAFRGEELLSVISLFITGPEARFRKFATHPDYQGQGLGTALLQHVLSEARRQGARRIWCDARQDSAGFYARFGLQPEGEIFYKGPIPYQRMMMEWS
ncbi:GNAT family N-acetyltransferase [Hymenobacter sp. ASUV-10]|uniref:GNAT family N-acetyltransferase n=1 Tax=Hymenobacter aranciens TaxID=3063996 RepID=A0ABT9BAJ7_9BACT|nr:GNAT family N-acetyltransferase [Hymenobacter sp. ASUV-10]MDO7874658.1 GNAT family N-acetyltransferase [Hymenobacter sp. ASUV-10]